MPELGTNEDSSSYSPTVLHSLLNDEVAPLVPGRIYPTMCGLQWQYERTSKAQARTRFVCAVCHEEQIQALRDSLNELIEFYNTHLNRWHPEES